MLWVRPTRQAKYVGIQVRGAIFGISDVDSVRKMLYLWKMIGEFRGGQTCGYLWLFDSHRPRASNLQKRLRIVKMQKIAHVRNSTF